MSSLKHTLRDALVTGAIHSGIANTVRKRARAQGPLLRILCLHDVPDRAWFGELITLCTERYRMVSPEQATKGELDSDRINILCTFDDGYQSWTDVVAPVLAEHTVKGLFLITSGLLDCPSEEEVRTFFRERLRLNTFRAPLSWDGARVLIDAGHTIGAHTRTHADLIRCTESDAREEMTRDRARIQEELGAKIEWFAYPFGTPSHHAPALDAIAKAVGFTYTVTTVPGFAPPLASVPNAIPRTQLEWQQPLQSVAHWIEGGYDPVYRLNRSCR